MGTLTKNGLIRLVYLVKTLNSESLYKIENRSYNLVGKA